MKSGLNSFMYRKPNGDESNRVGYVITPATDMNLTIDLSEFPKEERQELIAALKTIHNEFLDSISEMGLKHNFRYFKEERVFNQEHSIDKGVA